MSQCCSVLQVFAVCDVLCVYHLEVNRQGGGGEHPDFHLEQNSGTREKFYD